MIRPSTQPRLTRTTLIASLRTAIVCLAAFSVLSVAPAAFAADDRSRGEAIMMGVAKAHDAILIRPLAAVRVMVGAIFLVPAAIIASPSGMEGIEATYDVLIDAPVEYAFRRELGDF